MKIECKKCGNQQEVNAKFIVTLIGAAMPIGGFWAWVTFFSLELVLHYQYV